MAPIERSSGKLQTVLDWLILAIVLVATPIVAFAVWAGLLVVFLGGGT